MSQFLLQLHNLQTLTKPSKLQSIPSTCFSHHPNLTTFPQKPTVSSKLFLSPRPLLPSTARFPIIVCKSNGSGIDFDVLSRPEEREGKPHRCANGIFWIILANIGIYLADHVFQVRAIKMLYLYHNWPTWYQFLTATFCHSNWSHLSSNLFFLYIFGKLVEEEEGNFALWLCYILTGVGANLVLWLVLPRNAVSIGASDVLGLEEDPRSAYIGPICYRNGYGSSPSFYCIIGILWQKFVDECQSHCTSLGSSCWCFSGMECHQGSF